MNPTPAARAGVYAPGMNGHLGDRLAAAIDRVGSPVCVGLDPVADKLPAAVSRAHDDPAAAIAHFCGGVLRAVAGVVPAVKIQSACFERYGERGVAALRQLTAEARTLGLLVVLDAKRGDIGVSADHYAAAALGGAAAADAVTLSPYLGADALAPFMAQPGKGLFVLVRTSNPGSDAVQGARLADGRTVAEMIGGMVAELGAARRGSSGLSDIGAVVGATKAADAAALRAVMPDQVFLVPGYGAQGGSAEDIRGMLRPRRSGAGDAGVLVTASRSIIYAFQPGSAEWARQVREAAAMMAAEVSGVLGK